MEIRESYINPEDNSLKGLSIWKVTDEDAELGLGVMGTWGYEWKGYDTHEGFATQTDARVAAMAEGRSRYSRIRSATRDEVRRFASVFIEDTFGV